MHVDEQNVSLHGDFMFCLNIVMMPLEYGASSNQNPYRRPLLFV